jgi:hypothetical protein
MQHQEVLNRYTLLPDTERISLERHINIENCIEKFLRNMHDHFLFFIQEAEDIKK